MNRKQEELLGRLLERSLHDGQTGSPAYINIQNKHRKGEELPDHLLPGRTIMQLSEEDKKLLEGITAEDFAKFRLNYLGVYPNDTKNAKRALEKTKLLTP